LKAWKYLLIILVILSNGGCAASKAVVKDSQNRIVDVYLEAISSGRADSANYIRENLKFAQAFGYVKPYAPVIEPADVRLVWIPAHKSKGDGDTLISGHWVYIMVKQSRWFIDAQKSDKVKIPLIIPYKETIKK